MKQNKFLYFMSLVFIRLGVLPFLLIASVIVFAFLSDNFLTVRNLVNVVRQSSFLTLVAIGQMFALLTGGFDLSVGTIIAISSVTSAMAMSYSYAMMPEMIGLAITIGIFAGIASGLIIGSLNGIGISIFGVSPFMMTLGISSIAFGIALYMTGGTPVYGMPKEFSDILGFGNIFGMPAPVFVMIILILLSYFLLNYFIIGRYFYAIGGNIKASKLSGIKTRGVLFFAYFICGGMAAIAGVLLTARLDTGEANIGSAMALESIAACVIAGVSLRGGVGRLENVVLGAFFIGMVQNGMNLARIESYLQTVVIGVLLILAVLTDQMRLKLMSNLQD